MNELSLAGKQNEISYLDLPHKAGIHPLDREFLSNNNASKIFVQTCVCST
jgi:hypothetical protein